MSFLLMKQESNDYEWITDPATWQWHRGVWLLMHVNISKLKATDIKLNNQDSCKISDTW